MTTLQAQMSERARERAATLQDSKDDVETKDLGKEANVKLATKVLQVKHSCLYSHIEANLKARRQEDKDQRDLR